MEVEMPNLPSKYEQIDLLQQENMELESEIKLQEKIIEENKDDETVSKANNEVDRLRRIIEENRDNIRILSF
jgi:hypothetical protein